LTEASPRRDFRLLLCDPALGDDTVRTAQSPAAPWQVSVSDWAIGRLVPEVTDAQPRHTFGRAGAEQKPRLPNGILAETARGGLGAPKFDDKFAAGERWFVVIPRGWHELPVEHTTVCLVQRVMQSFAEYAHR
jgi:hypothetical protein